MERSFHIAARSLLVVLARHSAYQRTLDDITAPVLLVHGTHDRLVPIALARAQAAQQPAWS